MWECARLSGLETRRARAKGAWHIPVAKWQISRNKMPLHQRQRAGCGWPQLRRQDVELARALKHQLQQQRELLFEWARLGSAVYGGMAPLVCCRTAAHTCRVSATGNDDSTAASSASNVLPPFFFRASKKLSVRHRWNGSRRLVRHMPPAPCYG